MAIQEHKNQGGGVDSTPRTFDRQNIPAFLGLKRNVVILVTPLRRSLKIGPNSSRVRYLIFVKIDYGQIHSYLYIFSFG